MRKVKSIFFYITGGMLEVQPHIVTVLADTAVRGDELDEAAAESAKKQAEEALEGASDETDIKELKLNSLKQMQDIVLHKNSKALNSK